VRLSRTANPDNKEPKVSAVQKLKESVLNLEEENQRLKREIDRGGGDVWAHILEQLKQSKQ
jgi:hypothetical protein